MSYHRDQDRRLRGVGAIASRDAVRERIPGGRAAGRRPSEFDPVQLARGTKVELEHTFDREIAREIAMDHLIEDPRYYEKLARMERGAYGALGADAPPQGCSVFANGNWYVRTPDGRSRKVSEKEAAGYPACDTTVTQTGIRPSTRPRFSASSTAVTTTTPSATSIRPSIGSPRPSSAQPVGPAGGASNGGARKPGSGTGTDRTGTPVTPTGTPPSSTSPSSTPPPEKTKTVYVSSTAPAYVPAKSVTTQWVTPAAPESEPMPAPVLDLKAGVVDQVRDFATKHKGPLMVGAGIGLLLLLTRD